MRPLVLILPFAAIAGCTSVLSQQAPSTVAPAATPFEVPMDPGQITCAQLANPNAQAEATNWVMGQARAAAIAGRIAAVPPEADVQAQMMSGCRSNPTARLASVARQLGV